MLQNDRKITISIGASRRAVSWQPAAMTLDELYARLQTPQRGGETMEVYLSLGRAQQDDLKDVGGFVGGPLSGPRRKAGAVRGRDLVTLDLDSLPDGATSGVLRRLDALGCGYCVYSTRKHRPDRPRLRTVIPLDRTSTADEYEPTARLLAQYLQPEMSWFDPSTFEASRLMYWPSCCADAEYIYAWADKPLVSVDGLLARYADWRDCAAWPQVPGAQAAPAKLAAKQGDPESKPGVVGAFCRAYDVVAAMGAFLPGVYEETAIPGRYTFTGGSTTGGAVMYDGGKFLYSHHATDPAGGRLVNAFDLVRLHRFGEMDDDAQPGTPTNRLPSYTAMRELAAADETVKAIMLDMRWKEAAEAFGEPPPDGDDWKRLLTVNSQGTPEKSMRNLQIALEHDPRIKGRLRLNLFSGRIDVDGELPWKRPGNAKTWNDDDAAQMRIYLEPFFGKTPKNDVLDAVAACASDQAYDPVRGYLEGLTWDGNPRLDTLLIEYLGAQDTPYVRAVTRKAFTAAVARILAPGCKYDTMLVLVGGQGRFKSSILSIMGGEWFSDSLRTFEGKEAMESVQGTWLNEVAEMHAMERSEISAVKAFLTKTNDYYRAAYGRYTADRPRRCVFFGTTNSSECLMDPTGGRRFWPVDIDARERMKHVFRDLPGERDQLWAEAVARWRLGETLYLPPGLEEEAHVAQEEHRQRHPWEGIIADFLGKPVPEDWNTWNAQDRQVFWNSGIQGERKLVTRRRVCAVEIWCEALGKPKGDMQQRNTREINGLLEMVQGWENVGVRDAGKPYGKQRCFDQKTATGGRATD